MTLKDLKFSHYEGDIFFIKKEEKIEGMQYGFLRLKNKKNLKGIVECVDLTAAAYPIPRNLRERLENKVLPRFYEINDVLDSEKSLPEQLGVEISKLNQEDILYGLESSSINKLLIDRGYKPDELNKLINNVVFTK